MATAGGPNTIEDGLVLYLDAGNVKSYKGEPTTNLVTNGITGDYGNAPGSSTTTLSPDGTSNATVPIPDATADRYQRTVAGGTYSTGTQLTYSWHYKQLGTHAGSTPNEPGGLYITGLVNCTLVGSVSKVSDLPSGWTRWQATFQITDGSVQTIIRLYFGYVVGIGGSSAAYYGHQLEQKTHATPFTTGTRSATQGLVTLAGNNTVDLSNVSFDSNAQMTFDGTDDYIDLGHSSQLSITNEISVFSWIKTTTGSGWDGIFGALTGGAFIHFQLYGGRLNCYVYGPNAGYGALDVGYDQVPTGKWTQVGMTFGSSTLTMYINGVAMPTTVTGSSSSIVNTANVSIGRVYSGDRYFPGKIEITKVYNRALTAQEVLQNYNALKGRFGL